MVTRSILRIALITAALLMVPAIAMQFTAEVNWLPRGTRQPSCAA